MVPIVGLLAAAATSIGAYTLYWYARLTESEREKADRIAYDTARSVYGKFLEELTANQFKRVQEIVKRQLLK